MFEPQSPQDELTLDYLIKFRRAKSHDTLEIMADAAEAKNPKHDAAICKAFVLREKELEQGSAGF